MKVALHAKQTCVRLFQKGLDAAHGELVSPIDWSVLLEQSEPQEAAGGGGGGGDSEAGDVGAVTAIKLELSQYSAAVGVPGLRTLQYVVDRLTPFRLADCLEEALTESLAEMEPVGTRRLVLRSFRVGALRDQRIVDNILNLEFKPI